MRGRGGEGRGRNSQRKKFNIKQKRIDWVSTTHTQRKTHTHTHGVCAISVLTYKRKQRKCSRRLLRYSWISPKPIAQRNSHHILVHIHKSYNAEKRIQLARKKESHLRKICWVGKLLMKLKVVRNILNNCYNCLFNSQLIYLAFD